MRHRRAVLATVIVVVAVVGLGALADAAHWDLDEPDAFGVHFHNDLGLPVVLALCHSDHSAKCEHPYSRDHITAGSTYVEDVSPDVRNEWAIATPQGTLLKCVVLYWQHYPGSDESVDLSTAPRWAWPCPRETPSRPTP